MKCECGEKILDGEKICKSCGKVFEDVKGEDFEDKLAETEKNNNEQIEISQVEIKDNKIVVEDKKNTNTKKIIIFGSIFVVILLLISLFANGNGMNNSENADSVLRYSDKKIDVDTLNFASYPICTVKFKKGADTDNITFYQDGIAIKNVDEVKTLNYKLMLDGKLTSGQSTVFEIRRNNEVLFNETFDIKNTLFDNTFNENQVYEDDFPYVTIKTNISSTIKGYDILDNLKIKTASDTYELESYKLLEDDSVALTFNIDNDIKTSDFKYEYIVQLDNKEVVVPASLAFEIINNISITQRKSDYSEYPIVKHYFEVNDMDGNQLLNSLSTDEFMIYESTDNGYIELDNVKVSKVSESAKSSIGLVADVSGSISYDGLISTKESLYTFLDVVDFNSYDEVELISFSDYFYEEQRFTNNKANLIKGVNNLRILGSTLLYDTLLHSLDRTVIQRGSKMIIATTDGMDNMSSSSYIDVIARAQKYEIPIYIIGIGDYLNFEELTKIAEETGGKLVLVNNFSDLTSYFETIYKIEKTGLVIEYTVEDLDNPKSDILVKLAGDDLGGEAVFNFDPIFVSWGGTNRIDDTSTPYNESEFDINYYDNTHSYEVLFEDVTWLEANHIAESKGGYLARITSEEEFDVIIEAIENATTSKAFLYWLGGSRENSVNGKYTWVDSNLNVMSETLPDNIWLPGEPTYYAFDTNGIELFEEKYLNMFYVESYDKWVLNDVTDNLIEGYGDMYEGKIAYVIEYEN